MGRGGLELLTGVCGGGCGGDVVEHGLDLLAPGGDPLLDYNRRRDHAVVSRKVIRLFLPIVVILGVAVGPVRRYYARAGSRVALDEVS